MTSRGYIAGFVCRSCRRVVEASPKHWINECPDPRIHPGIIAAALADDSHRDLVLTPSTVLGQVRDQFIRRTIPHYPDAESLSAYHVGTAVGWYVESPLPGLCDRQVPANGTLWGYPFRTGGSDLLLWNADHSKIQSIISNKFGNEATLYYAKARGELASPEDSAQVNMEAMLHSQMGRPGAMEADLWVWRGTIASAVVTKANRKPNEKIGDLRVEWIRQRAPRMTLEEIAALHPFGAMNTVAQAVEWLSEAFRRVESGVDPEVVIRGLGVAEYRRHLSCETAFGGTACRKCLSARVCLPSAGIRLAEKGIVEVRLPPTVARHLGAGEGSSASSDQPRGRPAP